MLNVYRILHAQAHELAFHSFSLLSYNHLLDEQTGTDFLAIPHEIAFCRQ